MLLNLYMIFIKSTLTPNNNKVYFHYFIFIYLHIPYYDFIIINILITYLEYRKLLMTKEFLIGRYFEIYCIMSNM